MTLVTKENPNMATVALSLERVINWFWCQYHDKYGICGISFFLEHIFLVLAGFMYEKNSCDGYRTLKWRPPLCCLLRTAWQVIPQNCYLKVSLKPKAAFYEIGFFYWFFYKYFCASKHWSWVKFTLLIFYNLYSGKFKFLVHVYLARAPAPLFWTKSIRERPLLPLRNPFRLYLRH